MLRKTVYFRTQEDLDKFNAISNKAEWLHDKLNPNSPYIKSVNVRDGYVEGTLAPTYTDAEETA